MIRKLKSGEYRIYSRKVDPETKNAKTWAHSVRRKPQKNMKRKSNILSIINTLCL
jgi:hypothetical protein